MGDFNGRLTPLATYWQMATINWILGTAAKCLRTLALRQGKPAERKDKVLMIDARNICYSACNMDAFESLIKTFLEREGFWVRSSYKVNLTKQEKIAISRPSCPRWEIDLVAYKAADNELRLVECKSYLDSLGVRFSDFNGTESDRYKLFTDANLRGVVTKRLIAELVECGSCLPNPRSFLCLAAGKVRNESDRQMLREHFKENNWLLWDDDWIRTALTQMSKGSYENDVASVVAKLLLRSSAAHA